MAHQLKTNRATDLPALLYKRAVLPDDTTEEQRVAVMNTLTDPTVMSCHLSAWAFAALTDAGVRVPSRATWQVELADEEIDKCNAPDAKRMHANDGEGDDSALAAGMRHIPNALDPMHFHRMIWNPEYDSEIVALKKRDLRDLVRGHAVDPTDYTKYQSFLEPVDKKLPPEFDFTADATVAASNITSMLMAVTMANHLNRQRNIKRLCMVITGPCTEFVYWFAKQLNNVKFVTILLYSGTKNVTTPSKVEPKEDEKTPTLLLQTFQVFVDRGIQLVVFDTSAFPCLSQKPIVDGKVNEAGQAAPPCELETFADFLEPIWDDLPARFKKVWSDLAGVFNLRQLHPDKLFLEKDKEKREALPQFKTIQAAWVKYRASKQKPEDLKAYLDVLEPIYTEDSKFQMFDKRKKRIVKYDTITKDFAFADFTIFLFLWLLRHMRNLLTCEVAGGVDSSKGYTVLVDHFNSREEVDAHMHKKQPIWLRWGLIQMPNKEAQGILVGLFRSLFCLIVDRVCLTSQDV